MFTNFKKAVLATRIRKAAVPSTELYNEAGDAYVDLITAYIGITKKVVTELAFLASRHADEIASAIVTLEPVYKDLKAHPMFKQIENEMTSMLEAFNSRHEDSITEKLDAVKDALKATE